MFELNKKVKHKKPRSKKTVIILTLRYVLKTTISEMAEILDLSAGGVRSRIKRAKKMLKERIKNDDIKSSVALFCEKIPAIKKINDKSRIQKSVRPNLPVRFICKSLKKSSANAPLP